MDNINGRRRYARRGYPAQSKTFTTKAEAEAWASMIESEMSRGVWVSRSEAEATTLYEALKRYEEEISLSKKGAAQEFSVLKTCKAVDLAKRPLGKVCINIVLGACRKRRRLRRCEDETS